jgi:hypothetical protein
MVLLKAAADYWRDDEDKPPVALDEVCEVVHCSIFAYGRGRGQRQPEALNSPSRAASRKASHSALVKTSTGPSGYREWRMATSPSARNAISTQLPPVGPL